MSGDLNPQIPALYLARRGPLLCRFHSFTRILPQFLLQIERLGENSSVMSSAVAALAGNRVCCHNSTIQSKKFAAIVSNPRNPQFCGNLRRLKRRSLILSPGVASVTVCCSLLTAESPAQGPHSYFSNFSRSRLNWTSNRRFSADFSLSSLAVIFNSN